jgi:hypothetical protein
MPGRRPPAPCTGVCSEQSPCKTCKLRTYQAQWYANNKVKKDAQARARYAQNKEQCSAYNAAHYSANKEKRLKQTRAWRDANLDRHLTLVRDWARKDKSRHTAEYFRDRLAEQCWRCAICDVFLTLSVDGGSSGATADHDHVSGAPRGALCRGCNITLGYFEGTNKRHGLSADHPLRSEMHRYCSLWSKRNYSSNQEMTG